MFVTTDPTRPYPARPSRRCPSMTILWIVLVIVLVLVLLGFLGRGRAW
jgi:hypothetical protein